MNDELEKCPSCDYHKGSEKIWRDFAKKQAEEIEYWKSAFERAMTLYDQVKHLEKQVYGGTTK
jgi:hypothetical protein